MSVSVPETVRDGRPSEFERTILDLLPAQGEWSEEGYLWPTNRTNRSIEFTGGRIEGVRYIEHGVSARGATATSALLPSFTVGVDAVLDAT